MKITVNVEKVITEEVSIKLDKLITFKHEHFQNAIDYILNNFNLLAGSHHNNLKDYFGRSQGGYNLSSINAIEFVYLPEETVMGKLTIIVYWKYPHTDNTSILILEEK